VAFSRCVYEGDQEEKVRLDNARERGWRGKFNRTGRVQATPEEIRRDGKCPLTPVEVCFLPSCKSYNALCTSFSVLLAIQPRL
jgi:hypothetical protein